MLKIFSTRYQFVIIGALTLFISTFVQAAVVQRYVDDDAALGGDGLSWGPRSEGAKAHCGETPVPLRDLRSVDRNASGAQNGIP